MLIAALTGAAAVAVAWRGGYTEAGRGATVVLAALALAAAIDALPERAVAAARSAPVVVLALLAAVGALSALWTVGPADDALRWALVIVAFAAIVVTAAALPGPVPHAAILLLVAVGCALAGLVGAAAHVDRIGLNICGAWRPAGPLEYPPALALVCAMGLPAALFFTSDSRRPLGALPGALCGWLLVATIGVSGSRTAVALAALSLIVAAVLLGRTRALVGALLIAGAGGLSALIVGGQLGDDTALALIAALLPLVLLVLTLPALLMRSDGATQGTRRMLVAGLILFGLAGTLAAAAQERAGDCAYAGFGHGRSAIWHAAWNTAKERPLQGSGLESFAAASRANQLRVRDVPVQYAHSLPLEAWVELGAAGALLVLALYIAVARAALLATRPAAALLAAPALAFLAANLLDWPWHLAGCGVLWAIAVGGLVGSSARGGRLGGGSSRDVGGRGRTPAPRH